jgi:orotate phosphoribosyltransferase
MALTPQLVVEMFERSGAFLRGHFSLTSGMHSSGYVQSSMIFGYPQYTEPIAADLAERFRGEGITCVVGPALGGVVLAYAIARRLGVRAAYAERIQGILSFERGFSIDPSDRVLIVEDTVITGGSVREAIDLVHRAGACVAGVAVVIDRSGGRTEFGARTERMAAFEFEVYDPEYCPLCRINVTLRRPRHGRL